jgi:Immunity protein 7
MLEYQGWATIREAFREQDESQLKLVLAVEEISEQVRQMSATNLVVTVSGLNGVWRLLLMGASNRKDSRFWNAVELFKMMARVAPGTYGELSFWDDEETGEMKNRYQVYVLKKGVLTLKTNPFLSPCLPELEE